MEYDYIICGAGTSGSVVAARLAASNAGSVLLIEAGGSDQTPLISDPNAWPMTLGTSLDWGFMTDASPDLDGRSIPYSMGKVLGGGSSIKCIDMVSRPSFRLGRLQCRLEGRTLVVSVDTRTLPD